MRADVALGVGILFLGWVVYASNRLVRHTNLVREAWSGIDVQLKRRHDLIPSPVEVVKAYASYEKGLLEDVTRLRSEGPRREPAPRSISGRARSPPACEACWR